MLNNIDRICREVSEKLRRPVLHAIKISNGTKSIRIAPHSTLTDSCTHLAKIPTVSQFNDSDTQIQTISSYTIEAYPVLIHWWVADAILLLCWSTACFVTLLSFTQHFYIAELYLILIQCRGIPHLITWLSNSQVLIHCWAITNPKTC